MRGETSCLSAVLCMAQLSYEKVVKTALDQAEQDAKSN